jgi:hypothetical protein
MAAVVVAWLSILQQSRRVVPGQPLVLFLAMVGKQEVWEDVVFKARSVVVLVEVVVDTGLLAGTA